MTLVECITVIAKVSVLRTMQTFSLPSIFDTKHRVLPPPSDSWIIVVLWLYIAPNINPN